MKDEDEEMAAKRSEINDKIKRLREEINKKVKETPEMNPKEAVVCATLAAYCRRISSHLENIVTAVTNPFPEIGFKLGKYSDYND